jgi:hypothetical protein
MMAVLRTDQGSPCGRDFDQYLSVSLSYVTIYMYTVYAVCAVAVVGKATVPGIRTSVPDVLIRLARVHRVVACFTRCAIWHSRSLMISTVC